jgi:3-oxoacyl-[acyl-carrier protein] reductase
MESGGLARPLAGRAALVTGGSRGVGRAICRALAADGASIGIAFRRDDHSAQELVAEITDMGERAVAMQASLETPEDVDRLAQTAVESVGSIDILVCNAGIASRGLSIAETMPGEVEHVMAVHAVSAHSLIHKLLPTLRIARRSDVIAISSSEVALMRANGAPYNMAKAALEALILTLAHEEASHGVRANLVAPGLVVTDMGERLVRAKYGIEDISILDSAQPFGRVCRPEDVARVVRFLVSEQASLITGQRIVVDGGSDALVFVPRSSA